MEGETQSTWWDEGCRRAEHSKLRVNLCEGASFIVMYSLYQVLLFLLYIYIRGKYLSLFISFNVKSLFSFTFLSVLHLQYISFCCLSVALHQSKFLVRVNDPVNKLSSDLTKKPGLGKTSGRTSAGICVGRCVQFATVPLWKNTAFICFLTSTTPPPLPPYCSPSHFLPPLWRKNKGQKKTGQIGEEGWMWRWKEMRKKVGTTHLRDLIWTEMPESHAISPVTEHWEG